MKICQYLRLHMKMICWRFYIKTPFTFWDMCTWDMRKVCIKTFRNNRICYKLAYFLRKMPTSQVNNSRTLRIKNAKFLGYCFDMNTNILRDFQICISVPLSYFWWKWAHSQDEQRNSMVVSFAVKLFCGEFLHGKKK